MQSELKQLGCFAKLFLSVFQAQPTKLILTKELSLTFPAVVGKPFKRALKIILGWNASFYLICGAQNEIRIIVSDV